MGCINCKSNSWWCKRYSYSLVLENVPDNFTARLDGGDLKTANTSTHEIVFENAGSIMADAENKTKTHTLTFGANISTEAITDTISIKAKFKQID